MPSNSKSMDITIDYDIMTSDSHLGKNLSDGVTKGSRIPNTIRHSLNNLVIEAGKSYVIKLILGVESVKVTAVEVESWTDEDPQVVELPYNPKGDGGEGGTTVTYAMAAEATTADLGKLICTDGHIHAYGEDADCTADRVAMITYVGSQTAETAYTHGLALALQDASEDMFTWSASMASIHTFHPYPVQTGIKNGPAESGLQYNATQNTASYPAFQAAIANNDVATPTDCSAWFLPSGYQWYQMFQALGSKNVLRDSFESVGGANLKKGNYQTSTEYSRDEGVYCPFGGSMDFTYGLKDKGRYVRSCLAF